MALAGQPECTLHPSSISRRVITARVDFTIMIALLYSNEMNVDCEERQRWLIRRALCRQLGNCESLLAPPPSASWRGLCINSRIFFLGLWNLQKKSSNEQHLYTVGELPGNKKSSLIRKHALKQEGGNHSVIPAWSMKKKNLLEEKWQHEEMNDNFICNMFSCHSHQSHTLGL